MGLPRSTFYDVPAKKTDDAEIVARIFAICEESHSINWSPRGEEVLFISNHNSNPDRVFNYDVFSVNTVNRAVRQLTRTKGAAYHPRWSPDGSQIVFL